MQGFYEEFDKVGWRYEKQKDGTTIHSKLDEGDPIAGIKIES